MEVFYAINLNINRFVLTEHFIYFWKRKALRKTFQLSKLDQSDSQRIARKDGLATLVSLRCVRIFLEKKKKNIISTKIVCIFRGTSPSLLLCDVFFFCFSFTLGYHQKNAVDFRFRSLEHWPRSRGAVSDCPNKFYKAYKKKEKKLILSYNVQMRFISCRTKRATRFSTLNKSEIIPE